MRRLCGWESQSGIPSESTISRTFGDFAVDEIASSLFKDFVKKVAKGRIVIHRSIDSTDPDLRDMLILPFAICRGEIKTGRAWTSKPERLLGQG